MGIFELQLVLRQKRCIFNANYALEAKRTNALVGFIPT